MQGSGYHGQHSQSGGLAMSPNQFFGYPTPSSIYTGTAPSSGTFVDDMDNGSSSPRYGGGMQMPKSEVLLEARQGQGNNYKTSGGANGTMRTSALLNLNDPVAMHLLVETAIDDSQDYEVLAYEELELLKKESTALSSRIDAVARKLALESKIRDAAQSLIRLNTKKRDSGNTPSKFRRGSFARKSSQSSINSDTLVQSQDELETSLRKCEELGRELWHLETRYRQVQHQLLRHTAGVLQMTHKGPVKRKQGDMNRTTQDGRPDSPESVYTYENSRARSPTRTHDDLFDEKSLYRLPDNIDAILTPRDSSVTSPVNEWADTQSKKLLSVESRLVDLNDRLRQLIIEANPERIQEYPAVPKVMPEQETRQVRDFDQHLEYLERGLEDLSAGQNAGEFEGRLETVNQKLYAIINSSDHQDDEYLEPPAPPEANGSSASEQIEYLEDTLYSIERLQQSLNETLHSTRSQASAHQAQSSQYEATLSGLWTIMQAGEEESRRREEADGLPMSPTLENLDATERFTLPAFSAKLQWLISRYSSMSEQQSILRRQIEQQRHMGARSTEHENTIANLTAQLESTRAEHDETHRELEDIMIAVERHQASAQEHFDALQAEKTQRANVEAQMDELQHAHAITRSAADAHSRDLDNHRTELANLQQQHSASSAQLNQLQEDLAAATAARQEAEQAANKLVADLQKRESEYSDLESEVVRLSTENTIVKAELDGAYGSRAQRAAEVMQNPEVVKKMENLESEVATLRNLKDEHERNFGDVKRGEQGLREELAGLVREFEDLTRACVDSERERDELERNGDSWRERCEVLEGKLQDEKIRWMGIKSPTVALNGEAGGERKESTSTQVMRSEFRKIMREEREKGVRALRAEQEERRKLEQLVRSLRRDQGGGSVPNSSHGPNGVNGSLTPERGRSGLSNSISAS